MRHIRKIYILLLFFSVCLGTLSAQTPAIEEIKQSDEYLWGEGRGKTNKEADNRALKDLISKISVSVEAQFQNIEEEVYSEDGELDSRAACKSVINTYSQATLANTSKHVIGNEPDAHIFRYVHRSDVEKIFEGRKNLIRDMLESASKAEERGKVDDALRNYYWAYCLLQSVPNANSVTDTDGHVLTHQIPERMNDIFDEIVFQKDDSYLASSDNEHITEVQVLYKGTPVTSMEYSYFDGMDWSQAVKAKDGKGSIEFRPGSVPDVIQFKCEYEFSGEAHINKEIQKVLEVMRGTPFPNAYIKLNNQPKQQLISTTLVKKVTTNAIEKTTDDLHNNTIECLSGEQEASYRKVMEEVISAIRSKDYAAAEHHFTEEGQEMYRSLISYGNARILGEPEYMFYTIGTNDVVCRSVSMQFSFKNNNKKFVEDVTFTFTSEGKIDCLAFALDEKSTVDILKHDSWSDYARKVLAEFLENYKTAYALKRLDYIRSIFDDNAVIITGKVVTQLENAAYNDGQIYANNRCIIRTRQSKEQYLRNLERCFESNEYINIRFANNDIIRTNNEDAGETYGIQIKQDYYSSNYGDTGYLFLMVDLNDPKRPIIKVRAWQPEKDPNFGKDGLVDISDF